MIRTLLLALFVSLALQPSTAYAAGTITKSSDVISNYGFADPVKRVRVVTVAWTADASAATVPTLSLALKGYLIKVVTNPGATAPTDNYDITLGDPEDSALDAANSTLLNRDTANTEQVYPVLGSTPVIPVFLSGTYSLAVTNNSVNSATGRIIFYLVDHL